MKRKIYLLVECEIETTRRKHFANDIGGIHVDTFGWKTKVLAQDILDIQLKTQSFSKTYSS